MGILEEMLSEIREIKKALNEVNLSDSNDYFLFDGKAAIGINEASELSGIGRNNLVEQTKRGEWPYFKNGIQYKYPGREFIKAMNEKGIKNMEEIKDRLNSYNY